MLNRLLGGKTYSIKSMNKFTSTITKLEDARTAFVMMKSSKNPMEFRALFGTFINNSRAITYAMQCDGSGNSNFDRWYKEKQESMKGDELIRFVHDARIDDFHKGKHALGFASKASFSDLDPGRIMANSPGKFNGSDKWTISLHGDGLYTIADEGTPRERRVPLDQSLIGGTEITILNPPHHHLGKPINSNDPIYICSLVLSYFEEFVYDLLNEIKKSTIINSQMPRH